MKAEESGIKAQQLKVDKLAEQLAAAQAQMVRATEQRGKQPLRSAAEVLGPGLALVGAGAPALPADDAGADEETKWSKRPEDPPAKKPRLIPLMDQVPRHQEVLHRAAGL